MRTCVLPAVLWGLACIVAGEGDSSTCEAPALSPETRDFLLSRGALPAAGERGDGPKWDVHIIESSFSVCTGESWINDTERMQIGEHADFSFSRARCAGDSGQFVPPADRPRAVVLVDYEVSAALGQHQGPVISWLIEPAAICPSCYEHVLASAEAYDLVYTHDDDFARKLGAKGRSINLAVPSLPRALHGLPGQKHELVSTIVSPKLLTEGHRLRQRAVATLGGKLGHLYGPQHTPLENKADALLGYMFHVVIENSRTECYFTEKITDCFATGTVPLYWGCERIGDHFDAGGILPFETVEELEELLGSLTAELYEDMRAAVMRNHELATVAYKNMSPLHQMWADGVAGIAQRLPSIAISSPSRGEEFAVGEDIRVAYSALCVGAPCVERILVLLNGRMIASVSQHRGAFMIPSNLVQASGMYDLELDVQIRGEGDEIEQVEKEEALSARVQFSVA